MSQLCTIKQNIIATDPSVNDARNTSVYIFFTYAARADFPRKYGNFPSAISSLIFGQRTTGLPSLRVGFKILVYLDQYSKVQCVGANVAHVCFAYR